jgi:hypothetical protein
MSWAGKKDFVKLMKRLELVLKPLWLMLIMLLGNSAVSLAVPKNSIFFRNDEFISSAFNAATDSTWNGIGATFSTDKDAKSKTTQFSGDFLVVPQQSLLNYVNIEEAFVQIDAGTLNLSFGRKKQSWSLVDESWNLGLWQPLFKWNPLEPAQQGLSGLFVGLPLEADIPVRINFLASNIFIPNQGAKYELRSGQFEKVNPWFKTPPAQMRLLGVDTPVKYHLQIPSVDEVISQPTVATQVVVGELENGPSFLLAYGRKPSNGLAMSFRGMFDLGERAGVVDIKPKVFMHDVVSADLRYKSEKWHLSAGVLNEKPQQMTATEVGWTRPNLEELKVFSLSAGASVKYLTAELSYMEAIGGQTQLIGELAQSSTNLSMTRLPYTRALRLKNQLLIGKGLLNFDITQGLNAEFSQVGLGSELQVNKYIKLFVEGELIKVSAGTSVQQSEMAQFEDNDRLGLGMKYEY